MKEKKDIEYFKKNLTSKLIGYELNYKFFEEGDLGSLNQVEFNSSKIAGNIDFWGQGWVGVFVWDYEEDEQLLNVLIEPDHDKEVDDIFVKLNELLNREK